MVAASDIPTIRRRRAALHAIRSGLARELRIAEGLTQAVIADSLGVDISTVSRYENGVRNPSGERGRAYLDLIADLIGEAAR